MPSMSVMYPPLSINGSINGGRNRWILPFDDIVARGLIGRAVGSGAIASNAGAIWTGGTAARPERVYGRTGGIGTTGTSVIRLAIWRSIGVPGQKDISPKS